MAGFGGEASDFGLERAEGHRAVALDGQFQFPGDGLVHIHDVARGQGDVEEAVQAGLQGGGELAAGGGLAATAFAGDQADTAQLDEVVQAGMGFTQAGAREELVGLQIPLEGIVGEAEVGEIH